LRAKPVPGTEQQGEAAVGRVVLLGVLWAAIHSLLASKRVKDLMRRHGGARYRDGLYRLVYNAQAVITLALAARYFLALPDRELYRARPPVSWFLVAGQAASLGILFSGVRVVGVLDFAGLKPFWRFLTGADTRPEPEAQGPPIGSDGEMASAGAFRFTRHPGNLGALGFFLLLPRMTANRAALTGLVALYVVLGSMHEELRLRAAYGDAFDRYRQRTPFLLPRLPADG
jgi:protein-S-isoprenylcysteine O-methyltransferase Ste14